MIDNCGRTVAHSGKVTQLSNSSQTNGITATHCRFTTYLFLYWSHLHWGVFCSYLGLFVGLYQRNYTRL